MENTEQNTDLQAFIQLANTMLDRAFALSDQRELERVGSVLSCLALRADALQLSTRERLADRWGVSMNVHEVANMHERIAREIAAGELNS